MRIWLVQTGEPLPLEGRPVRPLRTALLARVLQQRGHQVVWWASAFDHGSKIHVGGRADRSPSTLGGECLLLRTRGYKTNVSVARIVDQVQLAVEFERRCAAEPPPDIIHCGMPTIELCHRVGLYAARRGIPFVVDVRDLWPDLFLHGRGPLFRAAAAAPMLIFDRLLSSALRSATALTAVSEGYMEWALRRASRARRSGDRVFHLAYDGSRLRGSTDAPTAEWIRSLGIAPSAMICWFAGTLGRTYNVGTVVTAARLMQANGDRRFHFVVSGKGDEEAALRRMAAGLSNVTFTGLIDEPQLAALMRIAVIGLAAYAKAATQGLPNKIGEYSCGGLAIVSSLRGETERLVAQYDAGVHYDADDPRALVAHLQRLGDDASLLERLHRNSRRMFQEEFDADRIYTRMADYLTAMGTVASSS